MIYIDLYNFIFPTQIHETNDNGCKSTSFRAVHPETLLRLSLGYGSYAVVMELEYRGLKCAGQKLLITEFSTRLESGMKHTVRIDS